MINVPSVFRAMEKETVNRVAVECLALFEAGIKSARNSQSRWPSDEQSSCRSCAVLPLAVEILKEKLMKSKELVIAKYDSELLEVRVISIRFAELAMRSARWKTRRRRAKTSC